ncbi:salivary gland secretion 1 [Rhodotorula toruloides]|uniref:Salivary gland secretion 1 n=1 Tax=Rhodotorula toruloides TaxID=5286 RepID=A0A511KDW0_RHOTO|nr:salivary gland secretion 1 [Rhodotorula toruloides]
MYTKLPSEPHSARSPSVSIALPSGRGGRGGQLSPPRSRSPAPGSFADSLTKLPPRAKRLLALVVALVIVVGGPLALRSGIRQRDGLEYESPFGTFGGLDERVTSVQKPPRRTAANDGTPRAGLFKPLAGASSNLNPSVSLSSFLESHFGPPTLPRRQQPHVWLTMADATWARTGTAALHTFVERLNVERRARYGRSKDGVRDTKLVVMCLDEECVETVSKYKDAYGRNTGGGYAYAGYMHNRPQQILESTWPKLAAFIEVLHHRDIFFVDSDVAFRYDPYPYMESLLETYDIVAQENDSWDHFNTGWMWIRSSQTAADAWNEVLQMDMKQTSRDQNNFNEVLGTALLRQHRDGGEPRRKPLLSDFTAKNGLKVHVLDDNVFRSHHFEIDRPYAGRDRSVYVHMTCGDDTLTKVFVAKAQGFWGDVDGYYSQPPPLLTVEHLTATSEDVKQLMKILLTAAHYSNRTILPPSHATFLDVPSTTTSSAHSTRRIYSSFPIPHLGEALGVGIVEPRYLALAARELAGGNLRHTASLGSLLSLLSQPSFSTSSAPTVKLINFDWPDSQHWRFWRLPRTLEHVTTCQALEELPACDAICRGSREGVRVEEPWPSFELASALGEDEGHEWEEQEEAEEG